MTILDGLSLLNFVISFSTPTNLRRRMNDINKMFHSVLKTTYNKKALPIGKTSNGLKILNL
jgi:hypothetical protein